MGSVHERKNRKKYSNASLQLLLVIIIFSCAIFFFNGCSTSYQNTMNKEKPETFQDSWNRAVMQQQIRNAIWGRPKYYVK